MKGQDKRLVHKTFVMIVSAFGLIVSASLLSSSDLGADTFAARRSLIALAYATVSISGTMAVLFPLTCSGILGRKETFPEASETLTTRERRVFRVRLVHCHHFGAETETHELKIKGRSYCATCYGLMTGAILSLTGVVMFATYGWPAWLNLSHAYALYFVGVMGVIFGLVLVHGSSMRPWARFSLAVLFVIGTGFMLIATDALTANVTADLLVVLLAVFWVLARISLSH